MFSVNRLVAPLVAMVDRVVPKADSVVVRSFPDVSDQARQTVRALEPTGVPVTFLVDEPGSPLLAGLGCRIRRARSLPGFWAYWRARVVVHTHGVFGSCAGAPGKVFVNIWHGMPIKRLDADSDVGRFQTDLTIATSEVHARHLADTWALRDEQVAVVGLPRNDLLVGAPDAPAWLAQLARGRPLVFWLPTFRRSVTGQLRADGQDLGTVTQFAGADLATVDALMGELGAFCVIKPHPLSRVPEPVTMDNLAVVTTTSISQLGSSLYELLAHADLLVTDHSSVWVDFLLTGRPIVFAISDLSDYADTRGFYFADVEELLPGPLVTHVDQLGAAVADLVAGRDDWSAARRDALHLHHRHPDAHSAVRVADLITAQVRAGR